LLFLDGRSGILIFQEELKERDKEKESESEVGGEKRNRGPHDKGRYI